MLITKNLPFSWLKMNAFRKNPVLQKGTLKIILGTYLTIDRGFFYFKSLLLKEVGHLWTGYSYILFFIRSGAFFASIFSRDPVNHKWSQKNFQAPKCPFRGLQSMAFSPFSAGV